MAKMFYTLEEVAEKLGKSEEDVREMARTGELQEFRDRDKLMFKVEQIDLLCFGGYEVEFGDGVAGVCDIDNALINRVVEALGANPDLVGLVIFFRYGAEELVVIEKKRVVGDG